MEIKDILIKNNFKFKKALGQNFITDLNLLNAIAGDAEVTKEDTVVEIGAGGGTLTRALAEKAAEVIAFEVDKALIPVLNETLKDLTNVRLVFSDVLKMSDAEFLKLTDKPFKVVANLPYYITTPLVMRFIESGLPVVSLTVTVQKEVAERLTAKADSPEYGAITLACRLSGSAKITRIIGRRAFFPVPAVDSAVVNIKIDRTKYAGKEPQFTKRLIRSGFKMRRKIFVNNIISDFKITAAEAREILAETGYDVNIRGEALDISDYIKIADKILERHTEI